VEDAATRIGEYVDAGAEHIILQPVPVRDIRRMIPRIRRAVEQAV
jgi:hypothetical protein